MRVAPGRSTWMLSLVAFLTAAAAATAIAAFTVGNNRTGITQTIVSALGVTLLVRISMRRRSP